MLSKESLNRVLEMWTPDKFHLNPPSRVELTFNKYQRAVAFMEVFRRYIPVDTVVSLEYCNGVGVIEAPLNVFEAFVERNKDTMKRSW